MRTMAVVSALLCLSACAEPQYESYVGPLDPRLAPQVAASTAAPNTMFSRMTAFLQPRRVGTPPVNSLEIIIPTA